MICSDSVMIDYFAQVICIFYHNHSIHPHIVQFSIYMNLFFNHIL